MSAPPPPTIDRVGHRFLRGSVALTAGSWFSSFISLGLNLMLARLLGPSAFGVYAFVFAVNEFISIVSAFGIPMAVLQARDESDELYDTAYAMSAALGTIAGRPRRQSARARCRPRVDAP